VSFRFPETDVARWRSDAHLRGISLSEHVRLLLDEAKEPSADVIPIASSAVRHDECRAPGCEFTVYAEGLCWRHREMKDSPFVPSAS
jgi:hypothetical protein